MTSVHINGAHRRQNYDPRYVNARRAPVSGMCHVIGPDNHHVLACILAAAAAVLYVSFFKDAVMAEGQMQYLQPFLDRLVHYYYYVEREKIDAIDSKSI